MAPIVHEATPLPASAHATSPSDVVRSRSPSRRRPGSGTSIVGSGTVDEERTERRRRRAVAVHVAHVDGAASWPVGGRPVRDGRRERERRLRRVGETALGVAGRARDRHVRGPPGASAARPALDHRRVDVDVAGAARSSRRPRSAGAVVTQGVDGRCGDGRVPAAEIRNVAVARVDRIGPDASAPVVAVRHAWRRRCRRRRRGASTSTARPTGRAAGLGVALDRWAPGVDAHDRPLGGPVRCRSRRPRRRRRRSSVSGPVAGVAVDGDGRRGHRRQRGRADRRPGRCTNRWRRAVRSR